MFAAGRHRSNASSHAHDTLTSDFIAEHHAYLDCMQRIDEFEFDVIFNNSLHYVPVTMSSIISTPMLNVLHTPPFFEMINAIVGPMLWIGQKWRPIVTSFRMVSIWINGTRRMERSTPMRSGTVEWWQIKAYTFQ